jgi:hypothetical protein
MRVGWSAVTVGMHLDHATIVGNPRGFERPEQTRRPGVAAQLLGCVERLMTYACRDGDSEWRQVGHEPRREDCASDS